MKTLVLATGFAIALSLPLAARAADDVTCASYGAMEPHDQMAAVASMHQDKAGMAPTTGTMASDGTMAADGSMAKGDMAASDPTATHPAMDDGGSMANAPTAGAMTSDGTMAADGSMAKSDMAASDPTVTHSAMDDGGSMAKSGMSSKAMAMQVQEKCNTHPESTLRKIYDELF